MIFGEEQLLPEDLGLGQELVGLALAVPEAVLEECAFGGDLLEGLADFVDVFELVLDLVAGLGGTYLLRTMLSRRANMSILRLSVCSSFSNCIR